MDILSDLNPEQKKAVTQKQGPLLIVAGAGTGKTTVITRRIAWLIEQGKAKPDDVLALTFTDKASEEMEERVDRLLPYGYVDLWISTFHSFCERVLKAHGLDIGLSTDFKLLTQVDQWLLVRQNLEKFNLDYYQPLGNPTKFIQALLTHFSHLKDEEIWPEEYLEYAEKLRLNLGAPQEEGGTKGVRRFQSSKSKDQSKLKIQNQNSKPQTINYQQSTINNDPSEVARIEEVANAYHTYQQFLLENNYLDFGDLINYTLKLFRTRKNLLSQFQRQFKYILVDEFQDTNWAQYDLVRLLAAPKNNLTVVADDDQAIYRWRGASMSNVLQFTKDYPQAKQVVLTKNYRSCQNILDNSYKFIQLNNPNRLEVALPSQLEATPPGQLEAVHSSLTEVTLPGQAEVPLSGQAEALASAGRISKKLQSQTNLQAEIEHFHTQTAEEEVETVIKKIIDLKSKDKDSTWSDFAILVRANSQADAFCRGLSQAETPYQFLASRGLYTKPVIMDILAYFKLLDNYHESTALYRMLNSPVFKIKPGDQSKLVYQSYKTAESLYECLQKIAALPGISEESVKKVNRLLGFIEKHSDLAKGKNVGELYVTITRDLGYEQYLIEQDDSWAREQLDYLNQFYKRIQKFESGSLDPKLKDFMAEINLEIESGEQGSLSFDIDVGPDMVRVMTVHGAKGLEFKYVFVVNLVDKRFPTIERKEPIEIPDALVKEILPEGDIHLEEERRLFYVAMTRAKQGLYFTSAKDYGGMRTKKLSRFLYELGLAKQETWELQETLETREALSGRKLKPEVVPAIPASSVKQQYLPNHLSYSQLAAFKKCPLQYKFNFILHIPVYGKAPFSFGRTMHSTLQKFFARYLASTGSQSSLFIEAAITPSAQRLPTLQELSELYEESWIDDWYESKFQKQEYKDKGRKILKNFYTKIEKRPPEVLSLETDFNVRIGGYTIRGRIDRVDRIEGGVELIDYKTGNVKEKLSAEDKEQLLIYQIATEEALRKKPAKLTYWYFDDNKPVSFLGTEEEKEKLKKDILEEVEKIKASDFSATPGWQCKYCDFREICEFRAE